MLDFGQTQFLMIMISMVSLLLNRGYFMKDKYSGNAANVTSICLPGLIYSGLIVNEQNNYLHNWQHIKCLYD